MKWLQLDVDFQDDPKIRCLVKEWGGDTAISFWTLLLAFVGGHGGPDCRVKIDPIGQYNDLYIASRLLTKPQVAFRRLSRAAQLGLIDRSAWEQDREIFVPNMLKRVDNYTRRVRTKSVETSYLVQNHTHVEIEIDKEIDLEEQKELRSRLAAGFVKLWERYPAKDGRKEAEKHFNATVKADNDLVRIEKALTNYLTHLSLHDWKRPKNGKTWFNGWADWENWTEPPAGRRAGVFPQSDCWPTEEELAEQREKERLRIEERQRMKAKA